MAVTAKANNVVGRIKRVARPIVGTLVTAVRGNDEGRVVVKTRAGPARGLRFEVDLVRHQEYGYWLGKYDRRILQAIERVCRPGWTAWDCGTYLGYYTCFLARLVGPTGTVIAFEPDPRNLDRTQRNVRLNRLENVQFHQVAIGPPSGESTLLVSEGTNSHLPGAWIGAAPEVYAAMESTDRRLTVQTASFDDAWLTLGVPKPDLIKVDIEGAEGEGLRHIGRLSREVRPLIVLECHNPDCDRAAWNWAQQYGYRLDSLDTGARLRHCDDVHGTLLCTPEEDPPR